MTTDTTTTPRETALRSLLGDLLWPMIGIGAVASIALYFSPLLYHVLVELFSIIVAALALVTALISRRFLRNQYLLIVATALGWCAILDFVHMLTYEGMGLLTVDEQQVTLRLWIGTRLLQAISLFAAAVFMHRYIATWRLQVLFAIPTIALLIASFTEWLPRMFTPGVGPTPIKISMEWLIIAIIAAALLVFYRKREDLPAGVRRYMPWAMVFMMASEFLFTQYVSLLGPANLIGHVLKVIAYWFVYLGLVQTTLHEPFGMLSSAAQVHDAVPEPALLVDRDGTIRQANVAAGRMLGVTPQALVDKDVHTLFHNIGDSKADCRVCQAHLRGEPIDRLELTRRHGESMVLISANNVDLGEDVSKRLEVLYDVTELHQARLALGEFRRKQHHDREVAKAGRVLVELLCKPIEDLDSAIGHLLQELPQAFQAPHLLKVHLHTAWLTFGTPPAHARPVMLRAELETGDETPGYLQVYYEDTPRGISDIFTASERALIIDVARTIEELARRARSSHSGAT